MKKLTIIILIILVLILGGVLFFLKFVQQKNISQQITKIITEEKIESQLGKLTNNNAGESAEHKVLKIKNNSSLKLISKLGDTIQRGQQFEVEIYLDTLSDKIRGADVSLNFDPKYLKVVNTVPGTIFVNPVVLANRMDNNSGKVILSIGTFNQFSGTGVFGTVLFEALNSVNDTKIYFDLPPATQIVIAGSQGNSSTTKTVEDLNLEID